MEYVLLNKCVQSRSSLILSCIIEIAYWNESQIVFIGILKSALLADHTDDAERKNKQMLKAAFWK